MADEQKKQRSAEDKRKRSEAIIKVVLPMANATVASVAKVVVEHILKGV